MIQDSDYGYAIEKANFGTVGTIKLVGGEIVLDGNEAFALMIRQSRKRLDAIDYFLSVPERFNSYFSAVQYPVAELPKPRASTVP